jgi:P4 family phage/plasmid primase-like protien
VKIRGFPHSALTERYLVSAILANPSLLDEPAVIAFEAIDLLHRTAAEVFGKIRNMEAAGRPITIDTVIEEIEADIVEKIGHTTGHKHHPDLDELIAFAVETPPSLPAVRRMIAQVQADAAKRRAMHEAANEEERIAEEQTAAAMDALADEPPGRPDPGARRAGNPPPTDDDIKPNNMPPERDLDDPHPADIPHAADREPPPPDPTRYRMTEIGNGARFAALHGGRFRFVHGRGWSMWDGKRWAFVERGDQMTAAKTVVAELYAEASALSARASRSMHVDGSLTDAATRAGGLASALLAHAIKSSKAAALDAMLKLAQSETPIAASRADFDGDRWAFNVANGTLDLRTGQLRPHRQTDMITKLAPVTYDPAATCPRWDAFLARVLPDPELRTWLQRYSGYALTGNVSEQALAFCHGSGANGKNVYLDTIAGAMGDYAITAAPDLLLSKQSEAHPTAEADLDGVRLALCSEIDEGRAWNEALIKRITGDRTLRARKMGKDFYEFPATHKLIVAANSKPKVRGTDNGIWRRMNLVTFGVTIPEGDRIKDFDQVLLAEESPGILAWLVRGCLAWQRDRLGKAAAVTKATAEYREEQDVIGQWIAEECVLVPDVFTPTARLYDFYRRWCERAGRQPWTRDAMRTGLLGRPGITPRHTRDARGFDGIGIADHAREEEERQAGRQASGARDWSHRRAGGEA